MTLPRIAAGWQADYRLLRRASRRGASRRTPGAPGGGLRVGLGRPPIAEDSLGSGEHLEGEPPGAGLLLGERRPRPVVALGDEALEGGLEAPPSRRGEIHEALDGLRASGSRRVPDEPRQVKHAEAVSLSEGALEARVAHEGEQRVQVPAIGGLDALAGEAAAGPARRVFGRRRAPQPLSERGEARAARPGGAAPGIGPRSLAREEIGGEDGGAEGRARQPQEHAGVPVAEPARRAERGAHLRIGDVLVEERGEMARGVLGKAAADRAAGAAATPSGIEYVASRRDAHYANVPDRHQTVGTVSLAYNFLGDTRFGAVEWRAGSANGR